MNQPAGQEEMQRKKEDFEDNGRKGWNQLKVALEHTFAEVKQIV